jgi:hypothetical protein
LQNRERVRGSDKEYYEELLKNYNLTNNFLCEETTYEPKPKGRIELK